MRVIEAPNPVKLRDGEISLFLAGGISNCKEWQKEVIKELSKMDTNNLVVLNPRRSDFDITNPNLGKEQIEWEFNALNNMDIFSMYFDNSDSVQPICFYELGRHIERMQHRFVRDYRNRIIVNVVEGFSRSADVIIQTRLALGDKDYVRTIHSPKEHAELIYSKYNNVKWGGKP